MIRTPAWQDSLYRASIGVATLLDEIDNTVGFDEDDEHDALRDLVSWAYNNNYYHNRLDTDTFDSMANKIEGEY